LDFVMNLMNIIIYTKVIYLLRIDCHLEASEKKMDT